MIQTWSLDFVYDAYLSFHWIFYTGKLWVRRWGKKGKKRSSRQLMKKQQTKQ